MQDLIRRAEKAAQLLKARGETIAVTESSTGGLISAALLALPGASAYFLGGAVVYTQVARRALLDLPDIAPLGMRAATEPYARLLAQTARQRFSASWALAESGATGPTGTATATPPATAASPSRARASARSHSRPAAPTASATCTRSPRPRSICCWRVSRSRRVGKIACRIVTWWARRARFCPRGNGTVRAPLPTLRRECRSRLTAPSNPPSSRPSGRTRPWRP
jgi:PncC family amidohydrolase